jgi:hypothetical protein
MCGTIIESRKPRSGSPGDLRRSRSDKKLKIEAKDGESLAEATVVLEDEELIDLLQGLADVIEGKREHLHFNQLGGPQLVVRRTAEAEADPLGRQTDWWMGPLVLFVAVFVVIGAVTVIRWAASLI